MRERDIVTRRKKVSKKKSKRSRESLKKPEIRSFVLCNLIKEKRSPRRISKLLLRLLRENLSYKAIYDFINNKAKWLKQFLKFRGRSRRSKILNRKSYLYKGAPPKRSIDSRDKSVEEHKELGDYEVDSVLSKLGSKWGILSLRELKSRKAFFWKMPNLKSETVIRILLPFFQSFPIEICKTLTADNGSEFAELFKLEKVIATMRIYYCHPYCSYERGSVENLNGELRKYFPKGTDFGDVTVKKN